MATRRDFVKMGSLATVAGVIGGGLAGEVLARTPDGLFKIPAEAESAAFFTAKTFRQFINSDFLAYHKNINHPVSLKLIEARDTVHKAHTLFGIKAKSSSLLFKGSKGRKLSQDVYELKHNELGTFSVLLVPITKEGNYYEVVFSRI